jgi:transcription-repair coupling factor (superfamily II helicase)
VYGPVPEEVEQLLELAALRIKASRLGIKSIVTSGRDVIFSFTDDFDGNVESLLSPISGKVRISDRQTAYLRLTENYFEPGTLMSILRKILTEGRESKLVKQKN